MKREVEKDYNQIDSMDVVSLFFIFRISCVDKTFIKLIYSRYVL